jgi:hypothetical protein
MSRTVFSDPRERFNVPADALAMLGGFAGFVRCGVGVRTFELVSR